MKGRTWEGSNSSTELRDVARHGLGRGFTPKLKVSPPTEFASFILSEGVSHEITDISVWKCTKMHYFTQNISKIFLIPHHCLGGGHPLPRPEPPRHLRRLNSAPSASCSRRLSRLSPPPPSPLATSRILPNCGNIRHISVSTIAVMDRLELVYFSRWFAIHHATLGKCLLKFLKNSCIGIPWSISVIDEQLIININKPN